MGMRRILSGLAIAALLSLTVGCETTENYVTCNIETEPASAEVWEGQKQRDSTPCDLLFQKPGEYEIVIKKSGYLSVLRRITVVEEKSEESHFLRAVPRTMSITLEPMAEGGNSGDPRPTSRKKAKKYYE